MPSLVEGKCSLCSMNTQNGHTNVAECLICLMDEVDRLRKLLAERETKKKAAHA